MGFPAILVMLCGFSLLWCPFDWNWYYFGFLGTIWRTCGSKCQGGSRGIFLTLCIEFYRVVFCFGIVSINITQWFFHWCWDNPAITLVAVKQTSTILLNEWYNEYAEVYNITKTKEAEQNLILLDIPHKQYLKRLTRIRQSGGGGGLPIRGFRALKSGLYSKMNNSETW